MNENQIKRENENYTGKLTQGGRDKHGHEVYGEKPKMFSSEWWPYFMDYYKIHCIVAVVIVFLAGMTIYQALTRTHYDETVVFVGKTIEIDTAPLETVCDDITGNGKVEVMLDAMEFSLGQAKDEYAIAMSQRFMIELSEGDSYLYIIPRDYLEAYASTDGEDSGVFVQTNEWLSESVDEDKLVTVDGRTYGVDVSDNELLKSCGLDMSDKVLCIRGLYERVKDKNEGLYKNAVNMGNRILAGS